MIDATEDPFANANRLPPSIGGTPEPRGDIYLLLALCYFVALTGPIVAVFCLKPLYGTDIQQKYFGNCSTLLGQAGQSASYIETFCGADALLFLDAFNGTLTVAVILTLFAMLFSFQNWRRKKAGESRTNRVLLRALRLLALCLMAVTWCGMAYLVYVLRTPALLA